MSRPPRLGRSARFLAVAVVAGLFGITAVQAGTSHGKPVVAPPTVYDPTLNVTWLANADLPAKDTFGVHGINKAGSMDYPTARAWVKA